MKRRVLMASVHVGGGHHALRDSFMTTLRSPEAGARFEAVKFDSSDKQVEEFYRLVVQYLPRFNRTIFEMGHRDWAIRLVQTLNPYIFREARECLIREQPDAVLSTHFLLAMAFAKAKWDLGMRIPVIQAIPDYGRASRAFYPTQHELRADQFIVMEEGTRRYLLEELSAPPTLVHHSGFLPRQEIMEVSRQIRSGPDRDPQARRALAEALKARLPQLASFDPSRKTLLFLGGSAWTEKTRPVLERICADRALVEQLNVIVVCGKNPEFEKELTARYGNHPRVSIFGFIAPKLMAELMALGDLPVLGSLAPASMQELLELRCGPLMLFHYIPGNEDPHVPHIRDNELGLYEPDPERMVELICEALGLFAAGERMSRLLRSFPRRAAEIRQGDAERARAFPAYLSRVMRVVPLPPAMRPAMGLERHGPRLSRPA